MAFYPLQALIWPDAALCADMGLTMRLRGAVLDGGIVFQPEDRASFDTAFNIFPLRKWRKDCALADLRLALTGEGRFALAVEALETSPQGLTRHPVLTAEVAAGEAVNLTPHLQGLGQTALAFHLTALTEARLNGAEWQTAQAPLRRPEISLGITTFRREAAVTGAVAKFVSFAERHDGFHLVVVDNGRTLSLPPSPHVTLIPNRNLGGSGGFARALKEAQARGASHALFMDDDAFIDMEALARTRAFLAYATDPATAVIGGLTQGADPTRLWESGAVFHQICRPLFQDLDLTDAASAVALHGAPLPPQTYGGFWFFAFPLAHLAHWPFPFFIRGDDIAFSLSNPFRYVTLPGVVSFQDQDFTDKESALIVYLELRNHLIQHLGIPHMRLRRRDFAKIAMTFFARSLLQMHYDSLAALNLAVKDVLAGPDHFAAHPDAAERRAEITAAKRYEVWQPLGPLPEPRRVIDPDSPLQRGLMKLTLNGFLLPFFGAWGNHLVIARNQRGKVRPVWGAARITYVDEKRGQMMTVRHRKGKIMTLGLRSAFGLARLLWRYPDLLRTWQAGFPRLTSAAFWEEQFDRPE